jgi:peroxiredoxin
LTLFTSTLRATLVMTLLLLGCLLGPSVGEERTEWQLVPRLPRGQELVYRGTLREQSSGRGVQFYKTWKVEMRAFVLDTKPSGAADMAFLTKMTPQSAASEKPANAEPTFVRLDFAEVDAQGRLTAPAGTSSSISLEGPSTWEHGFILEFPRSVVVLNQDWLLPEKDRPGRKYRIVGTENLANASCVKVLGEQQSDDWDKPRADSTAWRRRDTIYVTPRLGVAYKLVRDLERREPAHKEATYRLVTDYELDSSWKFEGNTLDDRRREINQIRTFHESLQALTSQAKPQSKEAYEALLARIDFHTEKNAATPYREALTRLRARTAELALNPHQAAPAAIGNRERVVVGKQAPEFVVEDLKTKKSVSLRTWQGKIVVMVFYQPSSDTSVVVLRYLQRVVDQRNDGDLAVIGFSVSDDVEAVQRVQAMLSLTFPALAGSSLRQSYDVEATPRVVVLDGEGIVRGTFTGWGPEVPPALEAVIKKCQPQSPGAAKTEKE